MTEQEKRDIQAIAQNVLLDEHIEAGTHDWQDYERAKKVLRNHGSLYHSLLWTAAQWEVVCKVIADYIGV